VSTPTRIVVLISGRGSNFEALARADLPAKFVAVISNEPEARGLKMAGALGIATAVVDHRAHAAREDFEKALSAKIDAWGPQLVVLAGFMRVLTSAFVARYEGRLLNIHPSLLPAFPGLHTHRRAIEAGVRIHGCTVHFVTASLDAGPIVIQAAVPVLSTDSEETLAARVLAEEHRIYPQAVRWFCEGRLDLTREGKVRLDGEPATRGALVCPALPTAREQV
jgi:phosphoribosylglycinamide formyltransferase-1